jgi:hypothetical protein
VFSSISLNPTVYSGTSVKFAKTWIRRTGQYAAKITAGIALYASALVLSQYHSSHSGVFQQTLGLSRIVSKLKSAIRLGFDSSDNWMVLNTLCTPALVFEAPHMTLNPWAQNTPQGYSFNLSRAVFEAVEVRISLSSSFLIKTNIRVDRAVLTSQATSQLHTGAFFCSLL